LLYQKEAEVLAIFLESAPLCHVLFLAKAAQPAFRTVGKGMFLPTAGHCTSVPSHPYCGNQWVEFSYQHTSGSFFVSPVNKNIHLWYIYLHESHKNQHLVGKYTIVPWMVWVLTKTIDVRLEPSESSELKRPKN